MAHAQPNSSTGQKTPTSILAEFCAQQKAESPSYETVASESNPNVPIFSISANAFGFTSIGVGRTKSEAKHAASQNLIDILKECDMFKRKWNTSPQPSQLSAVRNNDAVGSLITFCQHKGLPTPVFPEISIDGQDHNRVFKMGCYVGKRQYFGVASTKKEAKQMAAQAMFKSIEQGDDDDDDDGNRSSTSSDCYSVKSLASTALQSSAEDLNGNLSQIDTTCIAKLITICQENCLKLPEFKMVSSTGQDHQKQFSFACIVEKYQCQGTASKKQIAKQNAAMAMIKLIEEKIEANELDSVDGAQRSSVAMTIEDLPTVKEVLAQYRRMKCKSTVPAMSNLRHRKDFFLKLPEQNQMNAKQVLMNVYSNPVEAKYIVHETMKALKLKYDIRKFGANRAIFTLNEPTFECTIAETCEELFGRVIDYLKNMLNMQTFSGRALPDVTNRTM